MARYLITLIIFIFISACNLDNSPESALRTFVSNRFAGNQSREELLDLTTGKLHQQIKGMDDTTFATFTQTSNLDSKKLKISLNTCQEERCFITYTLNYLQDHKRGKNRKNKSGYDIEVKKIAELHFIDGDWKIASVSNIKTSIDAKEPISP
ncbi:MAG: hypothetical protein HN730_03235 [Bdellovibrionales bacterium]|nr:hypothetical protein [Bdellovibrionales bacterium]